MFNLIWNFAKSKAITIMSKVNIKDIINSTEKVVDKVVTPVKQVKKVKDELTQELKPEKKIKEPEWQKYFPFSFFYGGGKFQPIYFFVTLFSLLSASMLFVKVYAAWVAIKKGTYSSDMISTADLATVLTFVSSLVLLYNNNKRNYIKQEETKTEDTPS